MDLVHIWYNDRYRSKVSISNILPWRIGHKGQNLGHKVKSQKKRVHFRGHSFNAIFMKLCKNIYLHQIWVTSGQKLGKKVNS